MRGLGRVPEFIAESWSWAYGKGWPTILRPAEGPPLKRPHGRFRGSPPAGRAAVFYPLGHPTP
jgi:hypothetical protein